MHRKVDAAPMRASFSDGGCHIGKACAAEVRKVALVWHAKRVVPCGECCDLGARDAFLDRATKEIRVRDKQRSGLAIKLHIRVAVRPNIPARP
ncbi:MAG: hypothetical protein ACJASZ_000980 [Yoonia sp.]|jgi:hypothetical protein